MADPGALLICLGEWLSEPKPQVAFEGPGRARGVGGGVALSPRARMLHHGPLVFINGEALRAGGRDRLLLQRLADQRMLAPADVARLSEGAREQLDAWIGYGWLDGT
jgi:50S ribosomal protein L16 3-hydroxylase